MLSTAPACGGLAGEMTTGWKTGSGSGIASNLIKRSYHFWPNASSLLSIEGFATLAGKHVFYSLARVFGISLPVFCISDT